MQHTIAAVFNNLGEAQQAREELLRSGFDDDDVQLSQNDDAIQSSAGSIMQVKEEGGISGFFHRLFSSDDDTNDAELYSEAVRRGNYVLTVDVPDDALVDRATEVIDRHHPVNIDEQASQWESGAWSSQDSLKQTRQTQPQTGKAGSEEKILPVVEEELQVGKRQVQRGGVRVYQRVTETPVEESIRLREEHVQVERRPVNQSTSNADAAFTEQEFEMRETAEEPVVGKSARVVEEVAIRKDVSERAESIRDTVRRTDVEVEQISGDARSQQSGMQSQRASTQFTDDDFRPHWNANYAQSGDAYEDYSPAYLYGAGLNSNRRYSGRGWTDIETNARSDWEANNPSSSWERVKAAVRHGWEKSTG